MIRVLTAAALAIVLASPDTFAQPGPNSVRADTSRLSGDQTPAARTTASAGTPAPPTAASPWALVLSGGVARGLAHVGVIRALEEEGLRPDLVVGTSMGAIVGALYASGYSSADIEAIVRAIDWTALFTPRPDAFAWRGRPSPRPFFRFVVGGRGIQLPTAALDDGELNDLFANLFLESEASAEGDFDRLSIPFRAVATDVATARPVTFKQGNLARAVRASTAIPFFFAPIREGDRLLVDGEISSHLPVNVARVEGAARVIAVDVASELKIPRPTATSVPYYLLRLLLQRAATDTVTAHDLLIRLTMPGYATYDFEKHDSLIAIGYARSIAAIRSWADSLELPRTREPGAAGIAHQPRARRDILSDRLPSDLPAAGADTLAPIAHPVLWRGLGRADAATARSALGDLPQGPFCANDLRPALRRLYRAGIFQSAWVDLRADGDSTRVVLDVLEKPARELAFAAAYGNDDGGRVFVQGILRSPPWPGLGLISLTGIERRYGRSVFLNVERRALGRGGSGPFVRAEYRENKTRVFARRDSLVIPHSYRREIYAGGQFELPTRLVTQLGVGFTSTGEAGARWEKPSIVLRAEAEGTARRLVEAEWLPGGGGYRRVGARLETEGLLLASLYARPTLAAALIGGRAPLDAYVGLGGPGTMPSLRNGEWLGRRVLAAGLRIRRPIGFAVSLYASGNVGVVHEPVGAADLGEEPRVGASIGGEVTTPFGPIRLDWGVGPARGGRLDVMLGERF